MAVYTIQVTNGLPHRPDFWQTVHDDQMDSDAAAKSAALKLSQYYIHVRVYRDGDTSRPWYIPPQIPSKQADLLGDA